MIDRDAESLAGYVPQRDFHGGQRRHVLAGLCSREDAVRAKAFEGRLDVQRILSNQHSPERLNERHAAPDGIGAFALANDALVGVNPHVQLVAVDYDLGSTDIGNLQLGTAVRGTGRLNGRG